MARRTKIHVGLEIGTSKTCIVVGEVKDVDGVVGVIVGGSDDGGEGDSELGAFHDDEFPCGGGGILPPVEEGVDDGGVGDVVGEIAEGSFDGSEADVARSPVGDALGGPGREGGGEGGVDGVLGGGEEGGWHFRRRHFRNGGRRVRRW